MLYSEPLADNISQVIVDYLGTQINVSQGVNYVYTRTDTTIAANSSDFDGGFDEGLVGSSLAIAIAKGLIMVTIIIMAVVGNLLVIISVFRFEKLHSTTNAFIVSLAFADILVAILVMPFNASQEIASRWIFGPIVCNIFNANDVWFSTASLQHLCCISMDRYIAITDPFHYQSKMTKKRVAIMLFCVWGGSSLISYIPIQLGWYMNKDHTNVIEDGICIFIPNKIYAAISSTISFWIPTFIMVFTYLKIYQEARKQEKQIAKLTKVPSHLNSMDHLNKNVSPCNGKSNNTTDSSSGHKSETHRGSSGSGGAMNGSDRKFAQHKKNIKREHKAAKTLGIIMGMFLLCWLPFFLWYVSTTMCDTCHTPPIVVSMLFWIGYFNSALNPLIYAFFNRDFRTAFKKLLGCDRLSCIRKQRGTEAETLAYLAEMPNRQARQDLTSTYTNTPSPHRAFPKKYTYEAVETSNCS